MLRHGADSPGRAGGGQGRSHEVADDGDPGRDRVVPVRGVRVRRDARRRGRASGVPGLRRRPVRARLAVHGDGRRHACARGRRPGPRRAWSPRSATPSRDRPSTSPGARATTSAIVPLEREWTRIGRSLAADVRFDDPTVSRRHALIVRQPDGVRVLDDRSLNGVFVNGERVEWRVLDRRRRDRRRPLPPALRGRRGPPATCRPPAPPSKPPAEPARRSARAGRLQVTAPATIPRSDGPEDRGPLPEGRDGQDDHRPAPHRRAAPVRAAASWPSTSTRRATCRTTSTSRRTPQPTIGDVLPGQAKAREAIHDGIIPANLSLAEAELSLAGKMGRELTPAQGAQGRRRATTTSSSSTARRPSGLLTVNALVAARLRAAERRGAVLRDAGRRAGARGHRAGPRRPEPRSLEWLGVRVQHRRHAHGALARGLRRRCRSTWATSCSSTTVRQSIAYAESAERGVSILDYRPDLGRTTSRSPTSCSASSGCRTRGASCARRSPRPSGRRPPRAA